MRQQAATKGAHKKAVEAEKALAKAEGRKPRKIKRTKSKEEQEFDLRKKERGQLDKKLKEKREEQEAQDIANAADISDDQAEEISNARITTKAEQDSLAKHRGKKFFGHYEKDLAKLDTKKGKMRARCRAFVATTLVAEKGTRLWSQYCDYKAQVRIVGRKRHYTAKALARLQMLRHVLDDASVTPQSLDQRKIKGIDVEDRMKTLPTALKEMIRVTIRRGRDLPTDNPASFFWAQLRELGIEKKKTRLAGPDRIYEYTLSTTQVENLSKEERKRAFRAIHQIKAGKDPEDILLDSEAPMTPESFYTPPSQEEMLATLLEGIA